MFFVNLPEAHHNLTHLATTSQTPLFSLTGIPMGRSLKLGNLVVARTPPPHYRIPARTINAREAVVPPRSFPVRAGQAYTKRGPVREAIRRGRQWFGGGAWGGFKEGGVIEGNKGFCEVVGHARRHGPGRRGSATIRDYGGLGNVRWRITMTDSCSNLICTCAPLLELRCMEAGPFHVPLPPLFSTPAPASRPNRHGSRW